MRKVVLAIVLIWALTSTSLLVVKISELQKTKEVLSKYKTYAIENTSKVKELLTKLSQLEDYKSKYFELNKKYSQLKLEIDRKNYTIAQLMRKITMFTKIPPNYYDGYFRKHNNTPNELISFVSNLTIPENLSFNKKIAYLEWALRNAGFKAHIAYGEVEDEKSGNESIRTWIVVIFDNATYCVDILNNKPIVFNATEEAKLELKIKGVEKELEYKPIRVFRDIYTVVDFFGNVNVWAWWKDVGFPPFNHST